MRKQYRGDGDEAGIKDPEGLERCFQINEQNEREAAGFRFKHWEATVGTSR